MKLNESEIGNPRTAGRAQTLKNRVLSISDRSSPRRATRHSQTRHAAERENSVRCAILETPFAEAEETTNGQKSQTETSLTETSGPTPWHTNEQYVL